ncbi:hypothetical protein EYF80_055168 [Liparis tanakae]|uniref:Uncharacterized protein n=1 Tax=Liparis tanakae TaxID=230148 RepID=A0A4Z2F0L0_9TELE|nr:hypothetical protein EYF80_055168 [Liparis tanakae]
MEGTESSARRQKPPSAPSSDASDSLTSPETDPSDGKHLSTRRLKRVDFGKRPDVSELQLRF